mmetsp:Transcript_16040/g.2656  ORF Transcript_16040/g.2656 Transcript_16040/m.2656 type:complete len:135 (+) Transcript_16040:2-406(+)
MESRHCRINMQNRLNKELSDLGSNPPENCSISLVDDDITRWRVDIAGPPDTPYEGGHFELVINVPSNYPFRAPDANFQTRIYHPNIKSDDGSICADIFSTNWAPTLNIRYVVDTIMSMLITPMPEHAVESEIAQ